MNKSVTSAVDLGRSSVRLHASVGDETATRSCNNRRLSFATE